LSNIYNENTIIMNIDKIIAESIKKVIRETEVKQFTPYTEKEAINNKRGIGRMGNPSYDNAKKADTKPKDYVLRGYKDYKDNYADVMDYPSYCKKFGLRR